MAALQELPIEELVVRCPEWWHNHFVADRLILRTGHEHDAPEGTQRAVPETEGHRYQRHHCRKHTAYP